MGPALLIRSLPAPTFGFVDQHWIGTVAGRVGLVTDRWLRIRQAGRRLGAQQRHSESSRRQFWNGSSTSSRLACWRSASNTASSRIGRSNSNTIISDYQTGILPRSLRWLLNRDLQMVKAGINYKFESGLPDMVAPTRTGRSADEPSEDEDLAKKSQNPIADLVSVPFQSNTNFNAGPFNRTQEVFNIQPVVPMHFNSDWNLISRTIVPLMSQPSPFFDSNTNGVGDITQSLFFSPAHPGALIWGVGPVFTIPSATDPILGTGRVLLGPTAVFLTTPGHWVIGVLLNNQWSVGGNPLRPSVNAFLAAAVRQLQSGARLVSYLVANHHRELAGGIGSAVDRADRRRLRSGFQSG